MIDEYRVGKVSSISKIERTDGRDRWEMMIDTGSGLERSEHEGYYVKTFKAGDSVIYYWRQEWKRIAGVFREDYFEWKGHDIENWVETKLVKKTNKKGKEFWKKVKVKKLGDKK